MSSRTNIILIIIFIFLLNNTFSLVSAAEIENQAKIGVSTMSIELSASPGGEAVSSFYVINEGNKEEDIEINTADWDYSIEGINRFFNQGAINKSLSSWIEITPTTFTLPGNRRQRVDIKVDIPEEEKDAHWGMILVNTAPRLTSETKEVDGRSAKFYASKTFGIKLFQTNPGNSVDKGIIKNAKLIKDKGMFFSIEFKNTGTTFLEPRGKIDIINDQGNTVKSLKIKKFKVLPDYTRLLKVPLTEEMDTGNYVAIVVIDFGVDHLIGAQLEFKI